MPVPTPGRVSRQASLLEHWDGRAWSLVPLPETGRHIACLGVAALAQQTRSPGDSSRTTQVHWDGNQWTRIAVPSSENDSWLAALQGCEH